MRRIALIVAVAGAVFAPATPAFAHGGAAPDTTAYRTTVTGISTPEAGLTVRTVEAGTQLQLSNATGHSIEILGYSGEPYLDVRPDGTWQNINSPADPTAPPAWRRVSTSTTVRWQDQRTRWLTASRSHRLRTWVVPLRVQTRTFEIRGTLEWEPPPSAGLWWTGAGLVVLMVAITARRWPRSTGPVTAIAGFAPISYATSSALDGKTPSLVLIVAGLLAVAASWRHPPFFLLLTGTVLAVFGGIGEASALHSAVLPAAGPAWAARVAVIVALGAGAGLAVTGALRLRSALPPAPASAPGNVGGPVYRRQHD